ncbi:nuclear transport factor 2 family protein [Rhodococcus sp. JS3073]|uniref:nuclear transport factor 2 family protein n=1 Tax=Rhodococcus sp. JS3073 TaxID=3002901 RepID=UPI00228615D9|nr:nuclear transport factor 2 family protein [Rhodococcus sp. JS3073]WAM11962.1 nuclear transport factor 2 family protein [Rhodococcus sp. JS3073]
MNVGATRNAIGVVVVVLVFGGLAGCGGDTSETASASMSPTASVSATEEQDAVLAQEARWLTAITAGDRDTIESILSPDFKHITSEGTLLGRDEEIASIVPVTFTMNATEQSVDIVGDTAVIHGVNTLTESGNVLARERFTDVFVKQNGTWMALSAQETAI